MEQAILCMDQVKKSGNGPSCKKHITQRGKIKRSHEGDTEREWEDSKCKLVNYKHVRRHYKLKTEVKRSVISHLIYVIYEFYSC